MLSPPFAPEGLAERVHLVTPWRLHCCGTDNWDVYTRRHLRELDEYVAASANHRAEVRAEYRSAVASHRSVNCPNSVRSYPSSFRPAARRPSTASSPTSWRRWLPAGAEQTDRHPRCDGRRRSGNRRHTERRDRGVAVRVCRSARHGRRASRVAGCAPRRESSRTGRAVTAEDRAVVGWAALSPYRPSSGYRFTAELSVYVARGRSAARNGLGTGPRA